MNRRPVLSWVAAAACSAVAAPAAHAQGELFSDWGVGSSARADATPARAPLAREAGAEVVIAAMNFLDRPYRRGGASVEAGFDCSGFTRHLFDQALGIELPRRADEQAHDRALSAVQRDALRAGDLVFFNTMRRTFSHVGIYLGDGRFIHAPRSGAQIRVESLSSAYWSRRFTGARRVVPVAQSAAR